MANGEELLKISFEYEGHTQSLEGKEAVDWLNTVNGMATFLATRGMNPFDRRQFDWKEEKKS